VVYAFAAAFACWALAVYGLGRLAIMHWRMARGRIPFPLRGMRVASIRIPARLADLPGNSGNYRGLNWARSAAGVFCRAPGHWSSVMAECRQEGDEVVVDVVLPDGLRWFYVGSIGFCLVIATSLMFTTPWDASSSIPLVLLLAVVGQYALHVRGARATARLLPRYLEAACAEAACARHENLMKLS
jgi:hypothetical protein